MLIIFIAATLIMFFCGCFWAFWATITIVKWVAIGLLLFAAIRFIWKEFF